MIEPSNFEKEDPKDILRWVFKEFKNENIAITTSCSLPVTVDMTYRVINPSFHIPCIFIDTLHHFPETLETACDIENQYNLKLAIYKAEGVSSRKEFSEKYGDRLWEKDLDRYHYISKVEPLNRALHENDVKIWITGRRRNQSISRKSLPIFEKAGIYFKVNPLANWTRKEVWKYVLENNVPYNSLHNRGYMSVGDEPLTTPTLPDSKERSGRWKDLDRHECGIHTYLV